MVHCFAVNNVDLQLETPEGMGLEIFAFLLLFLFLELLFFIGF
jgi:hypothetical protein